MDTGPLFGLLKGFYDSKNLRLSPIMGSQSESWSGLTSFNTGMNTTDPE